ncbi:MAG: hypothetical protein GXC73_16940 [Chitinophagaceae bacterium]|nr:hypothetical protein [Chitinophagaceae bacterium]
MKIQELLSQFLYKEKTLTLPGLGRFDLDPSVNVYELKEEGWPEGTISFTMNRNAVVPDDLLQFLMQQTGKMKPLAMSDLESYVSNGLQLINIGKPFPLKGIGSIMKAKDNLLTFEQGSPALEKIDSINTDHVRDRTVLAEGETEIDFSHEERKSSKKPIIISGIIIALALIGWAVWQAFPKKQTTTPENENTEQVAAAADTPLVQQPDSSTFIKDTAQVATQPSAILDTSSFKLIVETLSSKAKADARIAFHKGRARELQLEMKDSTNYQLILHVARPLRDTAFVKDSLFKYYGIKAKVF